MRKRGKAPSGITFKAFRLMNVLVALSGRFRLPLLRRTHPIGYDLTIGGFKWNDGNLLMSLNARQSGSQVSLAAAKRRSRSIWDQCQHALSRWVREQEAIARIVPALRRCRTRSGTGQVRGRNFTHLLIGHNSQPLHSLALQQENNINCSVCDRTKRFRK